MQSPDHPELLFVQAMHYARGRPDGPPRWLIAHTMEAGESSTRAENTAAYFADPGDGRVVSSHYCVDSNSVVQCVRLADTAFTVGNTPGNRRGINWEFSGFAAQTGAQWGDAFSMAMLRTAAPYWALDAARFGIPIERRTVAELRAGVPGLSTHNDFRVAFGGTTHTDPGSNFPWSAFIQMIKGGTAVTDARWRIESADPEFDGTVWVSDGITRRKLRTPGAIHANVAEGWPRQIILTDADRQTRSWTSHLDGVLGFDESARAAQFAELESKLDAVLAAVEGGAGGGVQSVTLSGTITGTLSGSAEVVTDEPTPPGE